MTDTKRHKPYLWATWLAQALSGDKHCEWSFWYKAHHKYAKRPDENASNLESWKADHAEVVRKHVEDLTTDGWSVRTEGQTKFTVYGKHADVGGQADVLAERGDAWWVDDVKTGQKRDSDFWQVVIYLAMLPKVFERLRDRPSMGHVIYRDSTRTITGGEAVLEAERVYARVREIASDTEPKRTPSASECRFCDIASCPDRVASDAPENKGEASEF